MTIMIYIRVLLFAIFFFGTAGKILFAQNWRGTVNADWNNSANWSSWPLNNVNIVIDPVNYTGAGASPAISSASVFTPQKILIQNGASVLIQNNLTTNDNVDVLGTGTLLTIQGGTVNIGLAANGRLMADLGAAIIIQNGTLDAGRTLAVGGASTITMNNGTINNIPRILMDLGGKFIFNNGNIVAGERLAIGDGDLINASLFQMNGGSLTVNTELTLVNEFGNHTPTINMAGGTLTVNGNVLWLGISPGSGAPQFNITGGTTTINGNIQNTAGSTVNLNMNISGTGRVDFNGTLIEMISAADSIKQTNNTLFFFNNTAAWINAGVYSATNAKVSFNGNTQLQGTGIFSFNDILINSTKTLDHFSPYNINVKGDFINHGNFISNLNKVSLNGNGAQVIDGNSITSFYTLYVTNSSVQGVTVKKSIMVTGF